MSMGAAWRLGDDELLAALIAEEKALRLVYGRMLELAGELTTRNVAATKGYRSNARLLQDLVQISSTEASRRLRHAEAVTPVPAVSGRPLPPPLPAAAEAMRAGAIGPEHLETIRRTISELPPDVPADDRELAELTLVQAAHTLDPTAIVKLGRTIHARLDQDGRPPTDVELRNPVNELRWHTQRNGDLELRGRLAAEGAALLTAVLGPLAKPRPALDGAPDPRTRAERHGDALVDTLRLAADSPGLPNEGGERPTLVVTIPLDGLRTGLNPALLGDTTLIDARMARRLACDSGVICAVLGARSEPPDIGRRTRTVPTAMRRALVLRDRGCAFPGCPVPARWCDAHHRTHWADGGSTSLSNLVLLCGVHHDLIHHSQWEVTIPDGIPEFIPPPYIDPARHPRRNPIHPTTSNAFAPP